MCARLVIVLRCETVTWCHEISLVPQSLYPYLGYEYSRIKLEHIKYKDIHCVVWKFQVENVKNESSI